MDTTNKKLAYTELQETLVGNLGLQIQTLLKKRDLIKIRKLFDETSIVAFIEAVEEIPIRQILLLVRSLRQDQASEFFSQLDEEQQIPLIENFTNKETREILDDYEFDELRDLLDEMPANIVKKMIRSSSPETRNDINLMLRYAEGEVGSIMNTYLIEIGDDWTVQEAIQVVRKNKDVYEKTDIFFVVNNKKDLKGWLNVQDLFFEKPEVIIKTMMNRNIVVVHTHDDQEDAANLMREYDFRLLPVLNSQDKLVGVVTADDIIDVVSEEATEDMQKMSAMTALGKPYLKTSIKDLYKSRIFWLIFLLIVATFTGAVVDWGQTLASKNNVTEFIAPAILATIAPVITDASGNAGSQTSTVIIRSIVLGEITRKDYWKVFGKEITLGFITGLTLAIFNMGRVALYFVIRDGNINDSQLLISFVSSLGILIAVTMAKLIGAALPIISKEINIDPATMSSPLVTTIADVISSFTFYSLTVVLFVWLMM